MADLAAVASHLVLKGLTVDHRARRQADLSQQHPIAAKANPLGMDVAVDRVFALDGRVVVGDAQSERITVSNADSRFGFRRRPTPRDVITRTV